MIECVIEVQLEKMEGMFVARKVMQIRPKYVVWNRLEMDARIRVAGEEGREKRVGRGERSVLGV